MEATVGSTETTPPDLTSLNGFASEDLVYNREGRLSPNQQLELRRAAREKVYEICVVVAFAMLNLVVFHAHSPFVIIMGAFIIYLAVRLVQRVGEFREGVVYEVVGDASAQFVPDSEGPDRYWLHIEGLKLEISDVIYAAFRPGGPYRIYYVAASNTAVGGEVLLDWRPIPVSPLARTHWWQRLSLSVD
jgi:hypothetical protein